MPTSGPFNTWTGDRLQAGVSFQYITSQLGQLDPAFLQGHSIEYQLCRGNGGNVVSAGWRVTLCDAIWHVSSVMVWRLNKLLYQRDFTYFLLLLLKLHLLNGLFFRTISVSQYQKGKTSLDLNEARDDGVLGCSRISWTICK